MTKVTQALFAERGAFDKIARLMQADPERTIVDLLVHMTKWSRRGTGRMRDDRFNGPTLRALHELSDGVVARRRTHT